MALSVTEGGVLSLYSQIFHCPPLDRSKTLKQGSTHRGREEGGTTDKRKWKKMKKERLNIKTFTGQKRNIKG